MIKAIARRVFSNGRQGEALWFHPRATAFTKDGDVEVFMTAQSISGSDVFGHVHWLESADGGRTFLKPRPIPGFGRKRLEDGVEEGVCDVVPEYHPQTGTVIAMGHNVYYQDNVLMRPQRRRYPVYAIWNGTEWSPPRRLEWNDPNATAIVSSGCAQRITLESGDLLIPLTHAPTGQEDRMVCSVRAGFDGKTITIHSRGNTLKHPVRRGLLEPSLASFANRFFMTIRAEDERGYVTTSSDGLHWDEIRPWAWDDGEPLVLSTTQQRWLIHSKALFLVYTRKSEENVNVMRWRAPLFVAQVDPERLCLLRRTERVALPMVGDGVDDPDHVARMGNFHTVNVGPLESWVTVGEVIPAEGYVGDTLIGTIIWDEPNELAPAAG
jgi:hypothetical protein